MNTASRPDAEQRGPAASAPPGPGSTPRHPSTWEPGQPTAPSPGPGPAQTRPKGPRVEARGDTSLETSLETRPRRITHRHLRSADGITLCVSPSESGTPQDPPPQPFTRSFLPHEGLSPSRNPGMHPGMHPPLNPHLQLPSAILIMFSGKLCGSYSRPVGRIHRWLLLGSLTQT